MSDTLVLRIGVVRQEQKVARITRLCPVEVLTRLVVARVFELPSLRIGIPARVPSRDRVAEGSDHDPARPGEVLTFGLVHRRQASGTERTRLLRLRAAAT